MQIPEHTVTDSDSLSLDEMQNNNLTGFQSALYLGSPLMNLWNANYLALDPF